MRFMRSSKSTLTASAQHFVVVPTRASRAIRARACLLALALSACAADAPPPRRLAIGDRLPAQLRARAHRETDATPIAERLGRRATVFLGWSVSCPCVERTAPRLQRLMERLGAGIGWIGVDGHPRDTTEQVHEKTLRIGAGYPVLDDSRQQLCEVLGIAESCQVAVFDHSRILRYRGVIDDDPVTGDAEFLAGALADVLRGHAPNPGQRLETYGCRFPPASDR